MTLRPDKPEYVLAPAFDNGTSLGFGIQDNQLHRRTHADEIAKLVADGHHHYGWMGGDKVSAQHAVLCAEMKRRVKGGVGAAMDAAQDLPDHRIEAIAHWCTTSGFLTPSPRRERISWLRS